MPTKRDTQHKSRRVSRQFDVFISYRRSDGSELAQLVRKSLTDRGYRVFVDVREMPSGRFPQSIRQQIASAPDFVLLVTPDALDDFGRRGDWLEYEVAHAFKTDRNIVPLRSSGLRISRRRSLPQLIKQLMELDHVVYSHEYSDAVVKHLCKKLTSRPARRKARMATARLAAAGTNVPLNIRRTTDWGLTGSAREVAFELNGHQRRIRIARQDKIYKNVMVLHVDGREIYRREVLLNFGFYRHSFVLDGAPCEFWFNWLLAGWTGGVTVGGYEVIRV